MESKLKFIKPIGSKLNKNFVSPQFRKLNNCSKNKKLSPNMKKNVN